MSTAFAVLVTACTTLSIAQSFDLTAPRNDAAYSAERRFGFDLGTEPNSEARPFFFSVAVPGGNYAVTVELGSDAAASSTTVKAESRRLMLESIRVPQGTRERRAFVVNVRTPALTPPPTNAPGGSAVVLNDREQGSLTWDEKLTLEFSGPAAAVRGITIAPVDVPTIYLLGDSTVTDQRFEDGASWGQMLPRFFGPSVAVANHAESGETLKSFVTALRFAQVLEKLQAGDWVFIQFGHNDQKTQWPQTYVEPGTTYRSWLKVYLAEARRRGATPVLVTSPQRRVFDADGRVRNTHGEYPAAVRAVAAEEQVALVDLERMSVALYEALGPEKSKLLFANGGRDGTHHNNFGAYELAQCVAQSIRHLGGPLAAHLVPDFTGFDPARPDAPAAFTLPPSAPRNAQRPRGH